MSHATEAMAKLLEAARVVEDRGDAFILTFKGIAQELKDHKTDPVAIEEIANRMVNQAAEFDAAILENTPQEPE